jgi:hypothetical protein
LLIREHRADAEAMAARRADEMRNATIATHNSSGFGSGCESVAEQFGEFIEQERERLHREREDVHSNRAMKRMVSTPQS